MTEIPQDSPANPAKLARKPTKNGSKIATILRWCKWTALSVWGFVGGGIAWILLMVGLGWMTNSLRADLVTQGVSIHPFLVIGWLLVSFLAALVLLATCRYWLYQRTGSNYRPRHLVCGIVVVLVVSGLITVSGQCLITNYRVCCEAQLVPLDRLHSVKSPSKQSPLQLLREEGLGITGLTLPWACATFLALLSGFQVPWILRKEAEEEQRLRQVATNDRGPQSALTDRRELARYAKFIFAESIILILLGIALARMEICCLGWVLGFGFALWLLSLMAMFPASATADLDVRHPFQEPYVRFSWGVSSVVAGGVFVLAYTSFQKPLEKYAAMSVSNERRRLNENLVREYKEHYQDWENALFGQNQFVVNYAQRLAQIDVTYCSEEFRRAFEVYRTAWADLGHLVRDNTGGKALLRAVFFLGEPIAKSLLVEVPDAIRRIVLAEETLKQLANQYGFEW